MLMQSFLFSLEPLSSAIKAILVRNPDCGVLTILFILISAKSDIHVHKVWVGQKVGAAIQPLPHQTEPAAPVVLPKHNMSQVITHWLQFVLKHIAGKFSRVFCMVRACIQISPVRLLKCIAWIQPKKHSERLRRNFYFISLRVFFLINTK